MPASLTLEEAHAYLDARPGWIILTTIGRDGMPHTVPIGYFRLGDDVYVGCRAGTQKVLNAERNPNVSLLVQSGGNMQDIKGLLIQGTATVFTDPADTLRLGREAAKSRNVPEDHLPTEARPGSAYIRVAPTRMISWDYSREG
jgi:nitroimidazol reductase NimA-like FMN-containing flavoprotein (pyridoxamine 5'-phosphate oxidase superfamily)